MNSTRMMIVRPKELLRGDGSRWQIGMDDDLLSGAGWSRLSWFISSVCLLAGANRNSVHTKTQSIDIKNIPITCEMMRKGTFGAAAAFAFFDIIFSEVYYILMTKNPPTNAGSGTNPNWQAHGVGSVGSGSAMPPQQSPYAL